MYTNLTVKKELTCKTTRKQIMDWWGVSKKTLKFWLEEIGVMHQRTFTPKELARFVNEYGKPTDVIVKVEAPNVVVYEQKRLNF